MNFQEGFIPIYILIIASALLLLGLLQKWWFSTSLYSTLFIVVVSSHMLLIPEPFPLHDKANGIYCAIRITESFLHYYFFRYCSCCHLYCGMIRFLKHYFLYISQFSSHQQIYVRMKTIGNTKQLLCKFYFYFLWICFKIIFSSVLGSPAIFMTQVLFTGCKLCVFISSRTPILCIRKDNEIEFAIN